MNLRDLRYLLAVGEHRHFGHAARACHVSQPTLSGQIAKLEESLGVVLFERTNKKVAPTGIGLRILAHAQAAIAQADAIVAEARTARDPLAGPLTLGVIPTLAPYLMPLILGPLRDRYPGLSPELWEDVTDTLVARVRGHKLDAALIATPVDAGDLAEQALFTEPFLAALPPTHPLAEQPRIDVADLAPDLLVMGDGHCLREQALSACARTDPHARSLRAASLETLINLVAAGYGTTLIPGLAASALAGRAVVLRGVNGDAGRTIRLIHRTKFPRFGALKALNGLILDMMGDYTAARGE